MNEIREAAMRAKEAAEMAAKKEMAEKAEKAVDAIANKATTRLTGWLESKAEMLRKDIRTFFCEETDESGKYLKEYAVDGCGVYFGRPDIKTIATRDFGPYVLGLEKSLQGSYFPYVLKINVRATYKLSKLIAGKLGLEKVSHELVDELLKFEFDCKLTLNFVSAEEFVTLKNLQFEPTKIGEEDVVIGKCTPWKVSAYVAVTGGELYFSRTDWYAGRPEIPDKPFIFDLRFVPKPKA